MERRVFPTFFFPQNLPSSLQATGWRFGDSPEQCTSHLSNKDHFAYVDGNDPPPPRPPFFLQLFMLYGDSGESYYILCRIAGMRQGDFGQGKQ